LCWRKKEIAEPRIDGADGKSAAGFFRFGTDIVCYGECSSGVAADVQAAADFDALKAMTVSESGIRLPFDISSVIENLRRENYVKQLNHGQDRLAHNTLIRDAYYFMRELLPVWTRRYLQRAYFKDWQNLAFPHWPVDFTVDSLHEAFLLLTMRAQGCDKVPFIWFWPEGASGLPNVAHLEPQRGGCCTVMPYFVGRILEIPLTTSQDYSIFHILNDYSIELWKKQIDLIQQKHGLLSFISHPDYLIDRHSRKVYKSLLAYLREIIHRDGIWETVPGEVDRWWRARREMQLVEDHGGWRIEGPLSERARVAYATLDGERIVYTIDKASVS